MSNGGNGSTKSIRRRCPPEAWHAHGQQQLEALAAQYGVQYIVVDRYLGRQPLLLRRVYPGTLDEPNASYEVYRVAASKQTP